MIGSVFREISDDVRSSRFLPGLSVGIVVSLILIVMEVSFATMIFSGPLESYVRKGIGMALAGTALFLLLISLSSMIRSVVGIPQDAPVALFSGIAASMAATMGGAGEQGVFITITAALMFSCFLTGIFFICMGRFRLAEFFRFMPYPVVSGFLAGTGWLLTKGSLEVMISRSLTLDSLRGMFLSESLVFWLPGVLYALTLFLVLRRCSNYLILPGSLLLSVLLYHLVLWIGGVSMPEARESGFIFQSFTPGSLWPTFSFKEFAQVEWMLILKQLPALAVIPFVSMLGLLLNTGGIELAGRREIDMNEELVANGAANLLTVISGAHPGYSSISLSVLGMRVGADTRLVGLTAAAVLGSTVIVGSRLLAFFPKAVLGGFLLLLGFFFLYDWLVDTTRKMPRSDYLLVVAVFLVICIFGYLQGVIFGLMTTMILFVVRISRVPLIRNIKPGDSIHSRKGRPLPHQRLLAIHGKRTAVYELEGYIFFGSVTRLIENISSAVRNQSPVPIETIILDFEKVNGFDISSVNNFVRLIHRCISNELLFAFAEPPQGFKKLLLQNLDEETAASLHFFPDLEGALQWAEDRLLEKENQLLRSASQSGRTARDSLFDSVSDELLLKLDRQAHVEELVEKLNEYLIVATYRCEEVVLSKDGEAEGLYIVESGVIGELSEEAPGRRVFLGELGPGSLFCELGIYKSFKSPSTYRAESDAVVRILRPEALNRLETDNPPLALEIYGVVIQEVQGRII
jgi:sulfate permease, SulP family